MSAIKRLRHVFIVAGIGWMIPAGATSAGDETIAGPALDYHTVEISGWLSMDTTGEWTLFSREDFENYYPFDLDENEKCVSVINRTCQPGAAYAHAASQRVRLTGFTAHYDELPIGDNAADRLMLRRYYDGQPVFNFCLRDFVFIATEITGEQP